MKVNDMLEKMRADAKLDCFGLLCPMPIIETQEKIREMHVGQVLEVEKKNASLFIREMLNMGKSGKK